jgi:hypothetical protein
MSEFLFDARCYFNVSGRPAAINTTRSARAAIV